MARESERARRRDATHRCPLTKRRSLPRRPPPTRLVNRSQGARNPDVSAPPVAPTVERFEGRVLGLKGRGVWANVTRLELDRRLRTITLALNRLARPSSSSSVVGLRVDYALSSLLASSAPSAAVSERRHMSSSNSSSSLGPDNGGGLSVPVDGVLRSSRYALRAVRSTVEGEGGTLLSSHEVSPSWN